MKSRSEPRETPRERRKGGASVKAIIERRFMIGLGNEVQ
jgi:hypothetical protein